MFPAQDPERLHAAQLLASHILSSLRDIRGLEIASGFEKKCNETRHLSIIAKAD